MIQQALPRSTSKGLFEVQTSQTCPVHQAHLIKTTKYKLGGNILAPSGTHSVTDLLFKGEDVRTLESLGPARQLEFVSNMYT